MKKKIAVFVMSTLIFVSVPYYSPISNQIVSVQASVSKKTLLKRAKKLKFGMSFKKVKSIMGKPYKEYKDESGYWTLEYNKGAITFGFNENKKLNYANGAAPQIEKQGYAYASSQKEARKNKHDRLIGFAQSFGRKPFDTIQKMPSVYKTFEDNGYMYTLWNTGDLGILVRIDDTSNNVTKVFKYDKKADDKLGELLYTGRTIIQKEKRPVYNY